MNKILIYFIIVTLLAACNQNISSENNTSDSNQNNIDTTSNFAGSTLKSDSFLGNDSIKKPTIQDTGTTGNVINRKTGSTSDITGKTGGTANIGNTMDSTEKVGANSLPSSLKK